MYFLQRRKIPENQAKFTLIIIKLEILRYVCLHVCVLYVYACCVEFEVWESIT